MDKFIERHNYQSSLMKSFLTDYLFMKVIILILKHFHNSRHEVSVTLIPKSDKAIVRKENHGSTFVMHTDITTFKSQQIYSLSYKNNKTCPSWVYPNNATFI